MAIIRFTNCQLCDEGIIYHRDLYISTTKGCIIPGVRNADKVIDLHGSILTPGFIDIQINGCYGFDFSEYSTEEEYSKGYNNCLRKLIKTGTTSICPTVIRFTDDVCTHVLPLLKAEANNDRTESLGSHCEGPIISTIKKGCHDEKYFRRPKTKEELYSAFGCEKNLDYIKIITAAPELDGILSLIPEITDRDIIFSIGHTMATYEQCQEAVKQGATMLTHIFDAMPQPHHRNPGPIGLEGLADERLCPYFGLISDGVHIHPTYINIIYNANKDRCCLVTDAQNTIGLPDGEYPWEGRYLVKKGRSLKVKGTDTIAGSVTDQAQCMRNLMKWTNTSLAEAVKCVTNHPARSVHVDDHKGFLKEGYDADLCVIDKDGNVKQVYKMGNIVYSSGSI